MRLSRLAKKRKKITRIKYGFFVVIAGLFIFGLSYVSKINSLTIASVDIVGNKSTAAAELAAIVEKDTNGSYMKLFSKRNALLYPKGAIENSVLDAVPRIKSAKIDLVGFTKATLTVTEREPFALWCATICYFLDSDGLVFAAAPDFSGSTFVRYRGALDETVAINSHFLTPARFKLLSEFVQKVTSFGLAPQTVVMSGESDFEMKLKNGGSITFDDTSDLSKTFDNLQIIITQSKSGLSKQAFIDAIEYIDLRFGNKVFYKLKK